MRKFLVVIILLLSGCQYLPKRQTSVQAGDVKITHDSAVQNPPSAKVNETKGNLDIPAGSKITITEIGAIPQTSSNAFIPSKREMLIQLPDKVGTSVTNSTLTADLSGSAGFAGPTPLQKATAVWMYAGIAMTALGVFFCTPWGGSNYRVGGLIAAGGVGMSLIGKFIDEIKIPAPMLFGVFLIISLAVYYGYRVRHKQIDPQPKPV